MLFSRTCLYNGAAASRRLGIHHWKILLPPLEVTLAPHAHYDHTVRVYTPGLRWSQSDDAAAGTMLPATANRCAATDRYGN